MLGTIIVASGVAGYFIYQKQREKKAFQAEEKRKKECKSKVQTKLLTLEEDFQNKAIAYYLPILVLESILSREEQRQLIANHLYRNQEVLAMPRIDWDEFVIVGEEGRMLDVLLEEKVDNYKEKNQYTPKDAYKNFLLENAQKEALKIIQEEEANSSHSKVG